MFFARFFNYAHDAMERFYDDVEGGYSALIMKRGLGFPSVHAEADFKAPIRFGDTAVIKGVVKKLGETSVSFFFEMHNQDGLFLCTTSQVHVCTDIARMVKAPFPPDVRASLAKHLAP